MFWAYIHTNGSLLIKRWFGDHRDYTDDCIGNPNVRRVFEPFEADSFDEARMILTKEPNNNLNIVGM